MIPTAQKVIGIGAKYLMNNEANMCLLTHISKDYQGSFQKFVEH